MRTGLNDINDINNINDRNGMTGMYGADETADETAGAGGSKSRIILHIDMDSFFASVEMRENFELRGKPVIIGADPRNGSGRGVVSTCSYEARKYGVHSAMPVSKAYMLCPQGIFLPVNMPLYREVSHNVMEILREYSDKFEQVSIDEAYLDVSHLGSFAAAEILAEEIQRRIKSHERLTCSVGVGKSKVVAKIASDFRKPAGITIVPAEKSEEFLRPLPIGKVPGIGKKSQKVLTDAGIVTVGDLLDCDVQKLISILGRHAADLKEFAAGNDSREVEERDGQKSVGRERTYQEDTKDMTKILETVGFICTEVHRVISSNALLFRTVTIKIRYTGFITKTRSVTLPRSTNDIDLMYETAVALINANLDREKAVRLIGVYVSNFDSLKGRQTKIPDWLEHFERVFGDREAFETADTADTYETVNAAHAVSKPASYQAGIVADFGEEYLSGIPDASDGNDSDSDGCSDSVGNPENGGKKRSHKTRLQNWF